MHGTACAPGYPSDSTRSLAEVGSQDGLRAAARTLTTLAASGRLRASTYTMGPRSGRAGAGATPVCDAATSDTTLSAPHLRPGMVQQVLVRPTTTSHAFTSLRHHPRPPCGRGWCSMAGEHLRYVGVLLHLPALSLWPASDISH